MDPVKQKPSLGRIVLYRLTIDQAGQRGDQPFANNGAVECPAVIVRVWSDTCVNLRLLTDGGSMPWLGSVCMDDDADGKWRWPPRV